MSSYRENASTVFITGAGPGDPALLTVKAKEVIEKADVIAYDNLVSNEILELALFINPKVKLIYAGKIAGNQEKSNKQENTNDLLLKLSKEYKTLCRLKGGDPNVFGRGGEEAIFLKENNINFEIIPGVSSANAVTAYAGIPLTHRDCTSSFTVLTAHEDPDNLESSINWQSFDAINSTLVLLMGVKQLPKIMKKLISLGRKDSTPVAIISHGTTSKQSTIVSTLKDVTLDIEKENIASPSMIVIGEVVNYRDVLNWFESKPLFGKKVLITRGKEQSYSFASKLIKCGARPISCPIVSYELIEKEIYNKNIINNIAKFDWIFFTSQNSVKYFFEILSKNCFDSRALSKSQIAVVGYKTKLELEKYNIKADFVPKRFSFEDLMDELTEKLDLKDKSILLPSQLDASNKQSEQITVWPIYKANFIAAIDNNVLNQIKEGIDIATFFSSNTLSHFMKLAEKHNIVSEIKKSSVAVIGEETAKAAKSLIGRVDVMAEPFTEDGLISELEKHSLKGAFVDA